MTQLGTRPGAQTEGVGNLTGDDKMKTQVQLDRAKSHAETAAG